MAVPVEARRGVVRPHALLAAALAVAVLATFFPVVGNGFINFDDDRYVTENPPVLRGLSWAGVRWAFTALHAANWHPLTWLSHMADVSLFGPWAGGHHLVSVALHAANAVLLFLALRGMTGTLWRSAAAAAFFALHPLRVESVAWVAERKDVLSAFFWMAALLAYSRHARAPSPRRFLAVGACYALGLLAKPMAVTLPLVLLLLDVWPLGRLGPSAAKEPLRARLGPLVREKLPLLPLAAVSIGTTLLAQHREGAVQTLSRYPLDVRLSTALAAAADYLRKSAWPVDLAVFYPHTGQHPPSWRLAFAAAVLLAISALALRAAARQPAFAVGWSWYLVTLAPVSGLVQVGSQYIADRYTYLPLVGPVIAVVWLASGRVTSALRRGVLCGVAFPLLAGLAAATSVQLGHWRSSETVFRRALSVTSGNWLAHNQLGVELALQGSHREAEAQLRLAAELLPEYAVARVNLGNVLVDQGRIETALPFYREALRINPRYAQAHYFLGRALADLGKRDEAGYHLAEALELRRGAAEAKRNPGRGRESSAQ